VVTAQCVTHSGGGWFGRPQGAARGQGKRNEYGREPEGGAHGASLRSPGGCPDVFPVTPQGCLAERSTSALNSSNRAGEDPDRPPDRCRRHSTRLRLPPDAS